MGIYYSEDGRFATSTLDIESIKYLTRKGRNDSKYAIKIQRWWRNIRNKFD